MDVQHTDGLCVSRKTDVTFWEVDGTKGGAVVDVPYKSGTDFNTNGGLCLLGGATDVRGENGVWASLELTLKVGSVGKRFNRVYVLQK